MTGSFLLIIVIGLLGMLTPTEHDAAKDALKWAARTYVIAALSSIATLLYYVNIYSSRS